MTLIRPKQRVVTAINPHNANSRYIVPNRSKGYRALSWSTIPGFVFYEGVPANVDFRAWLSGTNRATATITEGDTFPAGFSFNNGVLSWDGSGSAPNTVENQMTASDGEGPDADSNLFNIQVLEYTALSWDVMPNWNPVIGGGEQTYDVRSYLNGTNAATAVISGVAPTQLPVDSGYSWDGSVLTFLDTTQSSAELTIQATDGVGPAADSYFESIPVFSIDLISAEWTINNKNGTLDSRDPDYVPSALTWDDPQSDVFFSEGVSGSQDTRDNLSGSNAATATITQSGNTAAAGVAFDDGVYSYDGVASAGAAVPDTLTADDGVTSPSTNPFNVQIVGGAVGFTPDSGLNVSAPGGFITGELSLSRVQASVLNPVAVSRFIIWTSLMVIRPACLILVAGGRIQTPYSLLRDQVE